MTWKSFTPGSSSEGVLVSVGGMNLLDTDSKVGPNEGCPPILRERLVVGRKWTVEDFSLLSSLLSTLLSSRSSKVVNKEDGPCCF